MGASLSLPSPLPLRAQRRLAIRVLARASAPTTSASPPPALSRHVSHRSLPPHCLRRQRVLLALSVAIVVASSEAALYFIWEGRRSKSLGHNPTPYPAPRRRRLSASKPHAFLSSSPTSSSDKKYDPDTADTHVFAQDGKSTMVVSASAARILGTTDSENNLRERLVAAHGVEVKIP